MTSAASGRGTLTKPNWFALERAVHLVVSIDPGPAIATRSP
jgi:hypothetical protein